MSWRRLAESILGRGESAVLEGGRAWSQWRKLRGGRNGRRGRRMSAGLAVERLEERTLLSVSGADFGDDLGSAEPLLPDETGVAAIVGQINPGDDIDMFAYTAVADGPFAITLNAGLFSDLDPYLIVYDDQGFWLDENDDGGGDLNSRVELLLTTGQLIYIEASDFAFFNSGEYELSVNPLQGGGPGGDDFGNDFQTAEPLLPDQNGLAAIVGQIDPAFDVDMFTYTAAVDGPIEIALNAGPFSALDPYLVVYDSQENEIASDDDSGGGLNSRLELLLTAGQLIYIETADLGSSTGDYDLTVGPLGIGSPGEDDFGNTLIAAHPLPLVAGAAAIAGNIEQAFDVDVFRVDIVSDGILTITQDAALDSDLDSFLTILDEQGFEIAWDDDSGVGLNSRIVLPVYAGQVLFIQAGEYFDGTGGYELSITTAAAAADDFADTIAGAHPLPLGPGGAAIAGEIEVEFDVDVFRVEIVADGVLTITQDAAPNSDLDSFLTILNEQGIEVAWDDDSGDWLNSLVRLFVSAGQTLYVQAGAYSSSTGQYNLTITTAVVDADDHPNTAAGAGARPELDANGTAGVIEAPYDVDVIQFAAPTDGLWTFQQQATDVNFLDTYLRIFNDQGIELAANDDDGVSLNSRVAIYLNAGDKVFVQAGAYGAGTGAYQLIANSVMDDFGNLLADDAPLLPVDTTGEVGNIDAAWDVDVFRVVAPETGLLRVRQMAEPGSFLDSFVSVFDADGTELAFDDDSGDGLDSLVEIAVNENQVLFIQAGGYGSSVGGYRITAEMGSSDDVGNSFTAAQKLDLSAEGVGSALRRIEQAGDHDVFGLDATVTGTMVVTITPTAGLATRVSVYTARTEDVAEVRIGHALGDAGEALELPVLVTAGKSYYIRVEGVAGTGDYALAVESELGDTDQAKQELLQTVGEAVADRLREVFAEVSALPPEQQAEALNLIAQAVIDEFLAAMGGQAALLTNFLLVAFDPVDFTLTDVSSGLQVGSTAAGGQVREIPNVFYSGDGVTELLIVPDYQQGQYRLELVGTNNQARAVAVLATPGSEPLSIHLHDGQLGKGSNTVAVLDFATGGGGGVGGNNGQTTIPLSLEQVLGQSSVLAGIFSGLANISAITLLAADPGSDPLPQTTASAVDSLAAFLQGLRAIALRRADGSLLTSFLLRDAATEVRLPVVQATDPTRPEVGPRLTVVRIMPEGEGNRLVLEFDRPVDSETAVLPGNFVLRWAGSDGKLHTADDQVVDLANAEIVYDAETLQISILVPRLQPGLYELELKQLEDAPAALDGVQDPAEAGDQPPSEDGALHEPALPAPEAVGDLLLPAGVNAAWAAQVDRALAAWPVGISLAAAISLVPRPLKQKQRHSARGAAR